MTDRRQKPDERSFYKYELIVWRFADILPVTPRQISIKAGVSTHAVADAMSGECKKLETLWHIAKALGLKWDYLFQLDLPESQFHRAVDRSGNSRAAR